LGDAETIIEQFSRKKADLRCRVCGHDAFNLIVSDDGELKSYLELTSTGPSAVKLRTVSMACGNCGHIEQFLFDTLMGLSLGEAK